MKNILTLIALATIALSGCTAMTLPRPISSDNAVDINECGKKDIRCISEILDRERFDHYDPDKMHKSLEGYEPPSLVELYDNNRIFVNNWQTDDERKEFYLHSHVLLIGGMSESWFEPHGDITFCFIKYNETVVFSKLFLVHELLHCAGYIGGMWEHHQYSDYQPEQKRIMKEEGVDRWVDTEFYKNHDSKYKYWEE